MQIIRAIERNNAMFVGWGARILVLSEGGGHCPIAPRLTQLGGKVDVVDELFAALSEVIDDPAGYALFVVDCDAVGGLEAALRALQMLGEAVQRVPVLLISGQCAEQRFPMERSLPTVLRAPLSAVSLKLGVEHALRDRMIFQAA